MRILDKAAILKLPAGTLYSHFHNGVVSEWWLKGETCCEGTEFYATNLAEAILCRGEDDFVRQWDRAHTTPVPMAPGRRCRDGRFDQQPGYAVWDALDLSELRNLLALRPSP